MLRVVGIPWFKSMWGTILKQIDVDLASCKKKLKVVVFRVSLSVHLHLFGAKSLELPSESCSIDSRGSSEWSRLFYEGNGIF